MGRKNAAERIVEFLSWSGDPGCNPNVQNLHPREWKRTLQWMDDAGLSFYFLDRLKQTQATDAIPGWVLSRLETNLAANRKRVSYMADRFDFLNRKFNLAGARYAVLKGFSLFPQFCPDPNLRHQSDLDYLVNEQSLPVAQRIVVESGYKQKPQTPREFVTPWARTPSSSAEQYSPRSPHAVELHIDIWESNLSQLPVMENPFSPERAIAHHWQGFSFPALSDEDAYLVQVLHTCRHLFGYWIRMSCLFEIAYFLNRRHSDLHLWKRVRERVGDNAVLRDFVVVVTELAQKLFSCPMPLLIREWALMIRRGTRVWIDNYARDSAFFDQPTYRLKLLPQSKLILFLHQQYRAECDQNHLVRSRVLPSAPLAGMVSAVRAKPLVVLDRRWWKRHRLVSRGFFHLMAGLRYVLEIPRWRWLNRSSARSVSWVPDPLPRD